MKIPTKVIKRNRTFRNNSHSFLGACASLCALLFLIPAANAETIDFESVPGSTPVEGMEINSQFDEAYGITFSLSNGGSPILAQVGEPLVAFLGPPNHTTPDTPAPEQDIGQFFLTDGGGLGLDTDLIVSYRNPVAAASGVIVDIDYDEEWQIISRDLNGLEIDRITINADSTGTGDGIATSWSFKHQTEDIHSIVFRGWRPYLPEGFGLAFDNFSPASPTHLCEADFDGDRDVDGSDLAVFSSDFGQTDCGLDEICEGDFDDDGDVDGSDLAVFSADFGRTDCAIVPNG